jgi:hypothetical protein
MNGGFSASPRLLRASARKETSQIKTVCEESGNREVVSRRGGEERYGAVTYLPVIKNLCCVYLDVHTW